MCPPGNRRQRSLTHKSVRQNVYIDIYKHIWTEIDINKLRENKKDRETEARVSHNFLKIISLPHHWCLRYFLNDCLPRYNG